MTGHSRRTIALAHLEDARAITDAYEVCFRRAADELARLAAEDAPEHARRRARGRLVAAREQLEAAQYREIRGAW
jgi:hypothetical protein